MADIGWFTDPGDSGPSAEPALISNAGVWDNNFSYNPVFGAGVVDYISGTVVWSAVWTPTVADSTPTLNYPTADTISIAPAAFGFQDGTLKLSATLNGVPCTNSPLVMVLSGSGGAYGSVAWSVETTAPAGPGGGGGGGGGGGIPVGIQTLAEKPDESGYSVTESPTALLSCDLDGGSPRTRLDEIGGSRFVSLQWSGSKKRWQTVRDFLTQNVALNCPQFTLDLIIGTSEYQEYLCNVLPNSIRTSSPVGQYYVIKALLEVAPRDDETDDWVDSNCTEGAQVLDSAFAEVALYYEYRMSNPPILPDTTSTIEVIERTAGTPGPGSSFQCDFEISWEDLPGLPTVAYFSCTRNATGVSSLVANFTVTDMPDENATICKAVIFQTIGLWTDNGAVQNGFVSVNGESLGYSTFQDIGPGSDVLTGYVLLRNDHGALTAALN